MSAQAGPSRLDCGAVVNRITLATWLALFVAGEAVIFTGIAVDASRYRLAASALVVLPIAIGCGKAIDRVQKGGGS